MTLAAPVLSRYTQTARIALPGKARNDLGRHIADQHGTPHSLAPHIAVKHGHEESQLSLDKNPRTFRVRVKDALQRRVGKGRAVTVKQVARAVGCSEGTIENLMSDGGTSEPSSRVLRELMMFFDDSFANEVWGCDGFVIVRINLQKAAVVRKIMEAHDELRRLG